MKTSVPLIIALALLAAGCSGDDADDGADVATTSTDPQSVPATTAAPPDASTAPPATEQPGSTTVDSTDAPRLILTGAGATDTTIRIGLNADLSGVDAQRVVPMIEAQQVFWELVNDRGGIAGRHVELVIIDNGSDVAVVDDAYDELVTDPDSAVVMMSHVTGFDMSPTMRDRMVADDIVAIPLSRYSGWSDDELGTNVLPLTATYCVEAMNAVGVLGRNASTVAILTVPGRYGKDSGIGARFAAAALGLDVVVDAEGLIVAGDDPQPVIDQLVATQPDVVWTAMSPTLLARYLVPAFEAGLLATWSGAAPTWDSRLLATDAAIAADGRYVHSSPIAIWGSGDGTTMNDATVALRDALPDRPMSDHLLRGWLEASAALQLLELSAERGDLTRGGVVAALDELELDFGDLAPAQSVADDELVRATYLYDVAAADFDAAATLGDGDWTINYELLDGPVVSNVAESFAFEEPCFIAGR